MQESTSFAPGKVLLLGEHAVVYGHAALVFPISLGVTATIKEGAPRINAPALRVSFTPEESNPNARQLDHALRALFSVTGPLLGELTLDGDLPFSRGLGSSAAVATAAAKAIWRAKGHDPTIEELEDAVMQSERVLHKNPSGADAAASIRERCLLFRRGQKPQEVSIAAPLSLILVDTGERASTASLVAGIATLRQQNPTQVEEIMSRLGALSEEAAAALSRGELSLVGQRMDEAFVLLSSLGLSTPTLEHAAKEAKEAGALGAKLTGAGGGGCLVALSAPETAHSIRQHLRAKGFSVLDADALK
jgi:mevalonate kinase